MGSWKIGELAQRVGLTVRTLHHYDRIGLFSPSSLTESGHRLYSDGDIVKLQQIIALKQLGFGLKEIAAMLRDPSYDPAEVLRLQLARLTQEIETMVDLRDRVEAVHQQLQTGRSVSADEFMVVMQLMNLIKSPRFKSEWLQGVRLQYLSLGAEDRERLRVRGDELMAELRRHRAGGRPPDDPDVVELARRWQAEIAAAVPADEEFITASEHYYQADPDAALAFGMDRDLYLYIKQAISHAQA